MTKRCKICGEEKRLELFRLRNKKAKGIGTLKDGKIYYYVNICKRCEYDEYKKYRKNNPDKIKKLTRKHVLRRYNLTEEQFEQKLINQNYKCNICGIDISSNVNKNSRNQANIDHCHKSGKIRDILCSYCNKALGLVEESPVILQKMINYINKFHV